MRDFLTMIGALVLFIMIPWLAVMWALMMHETVKVLRRDVDRLESKAIKEGTLP